MFAMSTFAASTYALYRTIIGDRKIDRLRDAQTAAQQALTQVATNQAQTHVALTAVVEKVARVEVNVSRVEKATNSITTALVDKTALANLLQGRNEGVAAEKARSGTQDQAQPDGAPTAAQMDAANEAQRQAVSTSNAARTLEHEAAKNP
jgi:hypothetical protein